MPQSLWESNNRVPINEQLTADLFHFRRSGSTAIEGRDQLEHNEIVKALNAQSFVNPDQIELSKAIQVMESTPKIKITLPLSQPTARA